MTVTTHWNSKRMDQKISEMLVQANRNITAEYEEALAPIARTIGGKIRDSGRGGDHNEEFARQDIKAWRAGSGRLNVLFGWLNPGPDSEAIGGGGKLWYQWQDSGFHLFGGERWIDGVGATLDRRERVVAAIEEVNRRWLGDIRRGLNH